MVTGGQDSVGLRVPAHPVARALLAAFARLGGHGVAAPSANRFGHVSPTTAAHVADDLGAAIDVILDGGASEVGIESTIVSFAGDVPMLLRPGGIGPEAIARVLGFPLRAADGSAPRASGTLAVALRARTRARCSCPRMRSTRCSPSTKRARSALPCWPGRSASRKASTARGSSVRGIPPATRTPSTRTCARWKPADADVILVESIPTTPEWLAVRDRLARATHGEDDDRD